MILELTAAQIKEVKARFAMAAKENEGSHETELVLDWMDDSVQMVRK